MKNNLGTVFIWLGSMLGMLGGIVNALFFHICAIQIWFISNIILLIWAIGIRYKWWDAQVSIEALIIMYTVYTCCNIFSLMVML